MHNPGIEYTSNPAWALAKSGKRSAVKIAAERSV
jgi:hypothetical protein